MKRLVTTIVYGSVLFAGLVGSVSPLAAQEGKIVTIGKTQSPVLKNIVAIREKKDAQTLISSIRAKLPPSKNDGSKNAETTRRKAEMDAIGRALRTADAVAVDLAEITPTADDIQLAKAALGEGVPIVMENVSGDKMAVLVGTGTDADLVVAWSKVKGGRIQLNLWSDEPGVHGKQDSETKNYARNLEGFKQVTSEVEAILARRSIQGK